MRNFTEKSDSPRVAMLVVNNGEDVRVLKEAHSLSEHGYNVRVFGQKKPNDIDLEHSGEVVMERVIPITTAASLRHYRRKSSIPLTLRQRMGLLKLQFTWQVNNFKLGRISHDAALPKLSRTSRLSLRKPFSLDLFLELFIELLLDILAIIILRRPKGRIGRLMIAKLNEPITEFIYNEYLVYALSMYDAVTAFDPKIIHAHDLYMLQAGSKLKQKLNCKLVYDAHEYERDRVREHPQWRKDMIKDEETREIKNADAVITVSEAISEKLAQHYQIQPPHVVFNTSFSDSSHISETQSRYTDIRKIIGLNASTPLVVHIGKLFNMHRQTGLFKEMIQALNKLPNAHLALLGPNTELAKKQVSEWSARFDVAERVHVLDPIPYPYVPSFIRTANIGIVAMHGDNLNTEYAMPNKLFEVALAHLPLIVSDQQQIRKFVDENANGLCIDCDDPNAIAQAVNSILSTPEKYSYSQEQQETLLQLFSWPAQAGKLSRLYGALLSNTSVTGTLAKDPL